MRYLVVLQSNLHGVEDSLGLVLRIVVSVLVSVTASAAAAAAYITILQQPQCSGKYGLAAKHAGEGHT